MSDGEGAPAAGTRWQFDPRAARFRDTQTGRFLSTEQVVTLRDQYAASADADLRALAERVASGGITVQEWERRLQDHLRELHTAEYLLGRGGRNAMGATDWGTLGHTLREQYGYLRDFAEQVTRGDLSAAQIGARSEHYASAAGQSAERGRAAAYGVRLPHYPGDGSTQCRGRCKCYLRFEHRQGQQPATLVWWVRTALESCPTCDARSQEWAPLVVPPV